MKDGRSGHTVVAVTGLHRGESPQSGGAVVTSLRRRYGELRTIGLCYDPMESGIYSDGLDRLDAIYLIPYPRTGAPALMERLESIIAQEGIDMIVPCLDTEIANFIALEKPLRERGVRLCVPNLESFEDRHKANLGALCEELDIATPRSVQANDAATLAARASEIGYPCYVKGPLYGAYKVSTEAELFSAFADIYNIWGAPVLLQEAILGEEYDVVGVGDGMGGIVGHCSVRKLLRTWLGKGFAGVVVADPAIDEVARSIIAHLKWNGPFELEFLKAPGRPHVLFEMNPRFPSWVDFAAQIGCNLPAYAFEQAMGLPLSPLQRCVPGRVFVRHCTDIVADIADIAQLSTHGGRDGTHVKL